MGLAKVAVQWLIEHLYFVSSAVLADSLVLRNARHRQAAKRYMPPSDDSQQIEQLCLRNYLTDKIK